MSFRIALAMEEIEEQQMQKKKTLKMCSFRNMCVIKTSMYSGLMAQVYRCQKYIALEFSSSYLFVFFLFAKKMSHPHKFKSCYLVGFCFIRFFFLSQLRDFWKFLGKQVRDWA